MLDGAHRLALRGVANGTLAQGDAPAVRNLATAGLIQPVDGAWTLTPAGHAVLELEGGPSKGLAGEAADLRTKIRDWFMS
jgi:hypothetical protein